MFDPGAQFSAIDSKVAAKFKVTNSRNTLRAGTADSSGTPQIIKQHVNMSYNLGRLNDTPAFRVYDDLNNGDLLFGMDWIVKHNPHLPDWGV